MVKLLDNQKFIENIGFNTYIKKNVNVDITCDTIEQRDALDLNEIDLYKTVYVATPYPGKTYRLMLKDPITWRMLSEGGGESGGITSDDVIHIVNDMGLTSQSVFESHITDFDNPHKLTASQLNVYTKTETYNKSEIDNNVVILNNKIENTSIAISEQQTIIDSKLSKNSVDNKLYGRFNDSWKEINIPDSVDLSNYYNKQDIDNKLLIKIEDVPNDNKSYVRKNKSWTEITIEDPDLSNYYTKNDVYNKTEINQQLSEITIEDPDLSNYYTKFQTYNKEEIDNKIDEMVFGDIDLSNYYTKSQIYNKEETDNRIDSQIDDQIWKNGYLAPDYANMETINRIPDNNGTWVVERNGFIYVTTTRTTVGNNQYIDASVVINGKSFKFASLASAQNTGANLRSSGIFVVSKGDIVQIVNIGLGNFGMCSCNFIPPKTMIDNVSISDYYNKEEINIKLENIQLKSRIITTDLTEEDPDGLYFKKVEFI